MIARLRIPLATLLLAALPGCRADCGGDGMTHQGKADATEWRWSDHDANLLYSAQHQIRGYEVRVIRPVGDQWPSKPFRVEILDGGVEACSFEAHAGTVFTQHSDALYVADFNPIATGCTVVAYDLKGRRRLWECRLKGNPPAEHSKYRHQINIAMDGELVVVYGKESNGRYIEYVDPLAGRTVGHRKLPPEQ